MKKLLQINVTANWGSTGKIAEQIGLNAIANGWDSYIAYGRMMNTSMNKLIKIGSQLSVYEHFAENKFLDNEGLASRLSTIRFLREVENIKPDIVHLHNIHDHYLNYRLLLKYLADKRIPVVWTQHDQWVTTGHCMYTPIGCDRWKYECCDCPMSEWFSIDRSHRNYRLKKDLLSKLPSLTIVTVSEWLADNIRKSYLKDKTIKVIHNGIDLKTFYPQKANVYERLNISPTRKIILGVAAVWDTRKGLKDFYKLAEMLSSEEFTFVIVGKVVKKMNLVNQSNNIIFVERTQNMQELAQIYSAASVFVNPTYQDNYPTTNLEALACGTPVITYQTGGSAEAIDEKTGIVVKQGDVQALATAIVALMNNPLSREDCRLRAERHFNKDECFNKYIELYEHVI